MIKRKAFQFRFKANSKVEMSMLKFAGAMRFVWNRALALQLERLEKGEKLLSYSDLAALLVEWKTQAETLWLNEVPSQPLQQTLMNLDRAIKDAFNKKSPKRFPRFKKRGYHDSFRYPQGFKIRDNLIFLPKIGWVRYFKSRDILGTPKNVTVSRRGKHWFVSVQTEQEVEKPNHTSKTIVGIDVGVKKFATLSNGQVYQPINSFKILSQKLARAQRNLARKIRGSKNHRKQKQTVSAIHIKIGNTRSDYLHKVSTSISKNHAMAVLEDLKIANMSKSAKGTMEDPGKSVAAKSGLNRSILDQGWHTFKNLLQYKFDWSGGELIVVDPKYTSQQCSRCCHTAKENRLSQSQFVCVACGFAENADLNAAQNILAAGHAVLACGDIKQVTA